MEDWISEEEQLQVGSRTVTMNQRQLHAVESSVRKFLNVGMVFLLFFNLLYGGFYFCEIMDIMDISTVKNVVLPTALGKLRK